MKYLFVCMGNICRSPAAENIMRHLAKKNNLENDISCDSAGTLNYHEGQSPDHRMQKEGKKRGLNFIGKARHVNPDDFNNFDMLIGMDNENVQYLKEICPNNSLKNKIFLFTEFSKNYPDNIVPDPYYGGESGFKYVTDMIFDGCQTLIEKYISEKTPK